MLKSSFEANFGNEYYASIFDNMNTTYIIYAGTSYVDTAIEPNLSNRTFIAGNTYKIYLKYLPSNYGYFTKQNVENVIGKPLDSSYCLLSYNFLNNIIPNYTSFVCYQENPTLTIDFPNENQQISQAFNIHGSYYAPAGFTNLDIFVFRTYETASSTISYLHNQYYLDITEGQHNFSKLISDLPIGDYYLQFKFYNFNTREDFWSSKIINFRVLQDIPLVLGETSPQPIPPSYIQVDPEVWYSQNSSYATPTALFTSFSNSIAPVIASIGNYIYNFNSRFTASNAQETGEKLGNSIVLARSYLTNLPWPYERRYLINMGLLTIVIVITVAFILGIGIGIIVRQIILKRQFDAAESLADRIISEAKKEAETIKRNPSSRRRKTSLRQKRS